MLSRFHRISERNGRTDRQTDRIATSIWRVTMLMRDKNQLKSNHAYKPHDKMYRPNVYVQNRRKRDKTNKEKGLKVTRKATRPGGRE